MWLQDDDDGDDKDDDDDDYDGNIIFFYMLQAMHRWVNLKIVTVPQCHKLMFLGWFSYWTC